MLKEKEKVIVLVRGSDRPNYEATGVILGHRVLDVPGSVVHGDVIYKVAIGEPHYFNYAEREIHQNDVQRFIPLPDETAAAKHAEELPLAFAAVEKALAKLMPDEKIEIKEGNQRRVDCWLSRCRDDGPGCVSHEADRSGAGVSGLASDDMARPSGNQSSAGGCK